MDADLAKQAVNINSDVEDFFESYDLEILSSCEDIEKYVENIGRLKQEFRRVHYHLRMADIDNFETAYPDFAETLQKLSEHFKKANMKVSTLKTAEKQKREEIDNLKSHLEAEKLKKELAALDKQEYEKRAQLLSQRQISVEQFDHFIKSSVWNDIRDTKLIEQKIVSIEHCLEKFNSVRSNYVGTLGREECTRLGFDVRDTEWVTRVQEHLDAGKGRLAFLITERELDMRQSAEQDARERELAEETRLEEAERAEEAKIANLLSCAETLVFEIKTRYDTLWKKCVIRLDDLTDHEILELKKREDSIHLELRELIDKISEFEKFVIPCGNSADDMRKRVVAMRNNCSRFVERYNTDVSGAITRRDISERKLKNAAGLKISLTKFSGYNSDIDIYTFRSDFKKMIEPEVQNCLRADYLKKNYLGGAALNLVSKEESIDEIWKKLFRVYGDTYLLLQNKISALDKFTHLDRTKDDEKISFILSSLINAMCDLEKLANDYELQGELYYGGGLHKILELMGSTRERKFVKSISSVENLKAEDKWARLEEFLKAELKEREAYVLNEKVKSSMLLDKTGNREKKKKDDPADKKVHASGQLGSGGKSGNHQLNSGGPINSGSGGKSGPIHLGSGGQLNSGAPPSPCVCSICGKTDDHVLTLGKNGKQCIEYIACKKFVEMKTGERDKLLFRKRLCGKCLLPGVKFGSNHDCDETYLCLQDFVKKTVRLPNDPNISSSVNIIIRIAIKNC